MNNDKLEKALVCFTKATEYNPDYPKGTVAWQFPKYGDYIKKGLGLQITVSQGLPPDFFQVPQLFGLSMKKAKEALIRARLKLGKVSYQQNNGILKKAKYNVATKRGTPYFLKKYSVIKPLGKEFLVSSKLPSSSSAIGVQFAIEYKI